MKSLLPFLALAGLASCAWAGPHVVFVLGEKEYGTLETAPAFAERHLEPAGYRITFVTASHEPGRRDDFTGLAPALATADLCFLSVRRRAPATEDMQALKRFVAEGNPLVAIRTSSHAFHLRGEPAPAGRELWEAFDAKILGGNYHGHYRNEPAVISVAKEAQNHPILANLGPLPRSGKLYQTRPLAPSATLLLTGTIEGHEPEPVAWTHLAGPNDARIFYTSLGQRSDFADAAFRRLLLNAIRWALASER